MNCDVISIDSEMYVVVTSYLQTTTLKHAEDTSVVAKGNYKNSTICEELPQNAIQVTLK